MIRVLGLVLVLLAFPVATALAALPEPGPWTSSPGSRARVSFVVDPGSGLLQPVVRYRLARCGVRETVPLGLVARAGRRFAVVHQHGVAGRRAVVRLRLAGRFDSAFEAHGLVRGRIVLRGGRVCRIPALAWSAQAGASPVADEPLDDEIDEELDFDEDEEAIEDEEPIEPVEDDEP